MFKLESKYKPSGDQPEAIKELVEGLEEGKKNRFYWAQQEQVKHLLLQML